ncbi:MAG: aminoglycoside phosphotransferase family protein [Burkholderiaceae bacterium]|nr:aminoglycoside phosphotransferase family protein [Burkholderiaceae bacterium]
MSADSLPKCSATRGGAAQSPPNEESERLRVALMRMGLLGADEHVQWTPLTGGVSSVICLANTSRGRLCVKRALSQLKVAADWRAPVERNRAEVAWIRTVMGIAPNAVPRVLGHDLEGDAFAMEYLPSEQYHNWKALLLNGVVDTAVAAQIARILVAIHRATAHDSRLEAAFNNASNFFALRLDPYFGEAARRNPDCALVLQRLIDDTHAQRIALVHGDVSPKNLMIGPHGPVLLDAECATFGDPAFDLSFCLTHLLLKQVALPALRTVLIACFETMATAYLSDASWEPRAGIERRVAALLPALLLARVDGKSPVEYLDESGRKFVRSFARSQLLMPSAQLADLVFAWKESLGS